MWKNRSLTSRCFSSVVIRAATGKVMFKKDTDVINGDITVMLVIELVIDLAPQGGNSINGQVE